MGGGVDEAPAPGAPDRDDKAASDNTRRSEASKRGEVPLPPPESDERATPPPPLHRRRFDESIVTPPEERATPPTNRRRLDKKKENEVGLVVVAHGTAVPEAVLDKTSWKDVYELSSMEEVSGDFKKLVASACDQIRLLCDRGKYVHVITAGGRRRWTDVLTLGDVILREVVRVLSIDTFAPSPGARATIEVEGASKDVEDAAKFAMQKLQKRDVTHLTIVCAADEARDAFRLAAPHCEIDLAKVEF